MTQPEQPVWPPFVWTAIGLAIGGGFGLGAILFALAAWHVPSGAAWLAAAQAHGQVQLFGWAGLMVLGVGLHFLPRLRGAPLAYPRLTRLVLGLIAGGLTLRLVAQPALALVAPGGPRTLSSGAVMLSGILTSAGATVALGLLAATLRTGPPFRQRAGLIAVLPFLLGAFVSLWLALAANAVGVVWLALAGEALVPAWLDRPVVLLALYGFLVPSSIGMSARTFPLYFRTPLPRMHALYAGHGLLVGGLVARLMGEVILSRTLSALGELSLAAAAAIFVVALGIFERRRPLPRQKVQLLTDPMQLHAISAYGWLVVAAMLLGLEGLVGIGLGTPAPPAGAEWHALGAGFVTILILGVGAHMLPGFARRPLRSERLVWATLVTGNLAALLRLGPLFLPSIPGEPANALLALSGFVGVAAVACFAYNLTGTDTDRQPSAT